MKEKKVRPPLKKRLHEKRRIIITIIIFFIVILIISTTVGREIIADRQPGLLSFSIINFTGYLFFILMPVEALLPFYLREGNSGLDLVLLATATAIVAQLIDYSIGYLFSTDIINSLVGKKRYQKAEKKITQYGYKIIFLFNLFPLSSPIIVLVSGIMRLNLKRVLLYSLTGLTIKNTLIILLFLHLF